VFGNYTKMDSEMCKIISGVAGSHPIVHGSFSKDLPERTA
jgi:hypothetical protein